MHPTILEANGKPAFVVLPYDEYLGLTQTEMAARLDIRQPSYAAMEAVDANPKRFTRERIADALGLSLEQIT